MRHRPRVFSKLWSTHDAHIAYTMNSPGPQIGGKLLIAKNGQPLFKTKLEPISAGDAVSRPIMKILMTNHPLDIKVISVRCRCRIRQDELGVKYVESLVLHCPHVEEIYRNDHVDIQVIFQTKALLIPGHGLFKTIHRMLGASQISLIDIKFERHLAVATGNKLITQNIKIPSNQRKQVTRLGKWILPTNPVPPIGQITTFDTITVG